MKKIVLAIAVIAMVACFSSCKKTCKCVTKTNGVETATTTVESKNCADEESTTEMMGQKIEIKCTAE